MAVRDMGKVHAKPAVEAHASLVTRDRDTVDRGAHVNSQRDQIERSLPLLVALRKDGKSTAPIGETLVRPARGLRRARRGLLQAQRH